MRAAVDRRLEPVAIPEGAGTRDAIAKVGGFEHARRRDAAEELLGLAAVEARTAHAAQPQQRLDLVLELDAVHRLGQELGGAEHERPEPIARVATRLDETRTGTSMCARRSAQSSS